MSESWSSRVNSLKGWVKENSTNSEGQIDSAVVMSRVRQVVAKVDQEVDTDAVKARLKETVVKAEGAIDSGKLKQWLNDVDAEKVKGWAAEAKSRASKTREEI